MTCFAAPRSASVPTSWASECLTKVRSPGQRRLRFTHRYTFLPMRNANPGCAPVGRPFTSSMTGPNRALELARESAGSRDIRIAGGADVIQQYLNLGVVH